MTRSIFHAVALASAWSLWTGRVIAQDATAAPAAIQTLGCYQHPDPLVEQGTWTFQTSGYCQTQCVALGKAVMATTGGSTCYCGDELPPLDQEVSDSKCDSTCDGFPQETCGGIGFWQVYLSGLSGNVDTAPNSTTIATAAPTANPKSGTSTSASVVTQAGQTVIVTASSDADSNAKASSGPNKVGIAVGVVVGVIVLAAAIGGALFFLRRKRNREIEEEHRRNAAVSQFTSGKSDQSSLNDQRLDPSVYSHRRESIGSIADERDFTRRILQVRNPDRESKSSTMA